MDYMAMKGLTYVVVYHPDTKRGGRTIETWTGMLKDEDINPNAKQG